MDIEKAIRDRYQNLEWVLDERLRRLYAAAEAKALGHGGITLVQKATGVARNSIKQGLKELSQRATGAEDTAFQRIRRAGGGRKASVKADKGLRVALENLVEPVTRGDPESPLRWTCKSLRQLEAELRSQGYVVSHSSIGSLLKELGYSLLGNRKTLEGSSHPDRNAQFEFINLRTEEAMRNGQPVISVDTKKKELVGQYKNGGKELRPKGDPEQVKVYDFVDKNLGRANPYGVYDMANNSGWVSVGTDHDTASFAVSTIRRWWFAMGKELYSGARELVITADGGGSNGSRVRLWKVELQKLANELDMSIRVSHFPPGTSKWNKIEHRLFSFISMNWRGKPLVSHETIVNLIASTTTRKGLKVRVELDSGHYPKGVKVTDDELGAIQIVRDEFHGEWNYSILPIKK
ncbi:MAG: ISAzo13 family transposase [Desulfobacterales bacterium]|nr:ISAzo13 family transposase [Desulfobacterales bacterium]